MRWLCSVLLRQAYVTWVLVGVGGGVEVAENTPLVLHLVVLWPVGVVVVPVLVLVLVLVLAVVLVLVVIS